MADVIRNQKPLATSPIKSGQPLGAILASLGLDQCMPLVHGAQGCSAFAKVFFIQHFREPVPLQSTAMDPMTTIMGADDNILTALNTLCARNAPRVIVVISTGLSEAQGSDLRRAIKQFRETTARFKSIAILTVNTPDFYGSLENGFSALVEQIIEQCVPETPQPRQRNKRVNILLSHSTTPGDIELIRQYVEAFGLQPIILPDLSLSLDGHLAEGDFHPVSQGGTALRDIGLMGQNMSTIVIGPSLGRAATMMSQRSRGPVLQLPHLMTMAQVDRFIHHLHQISGRAVPDWINRQRGQVQDAMIDCHTWLQGQRMALAAEGDLLAAWCDFALSQGISPVAVIAPVNQAALAALSVEHVHIGDLEDMAQLLERTPADMLVCNSHGVSLADQQGIPLIRAGFPIFDQLGAFRRMRQGYSGIRDTLFDLANLMQDRHHHQPTWHSPLKQHFGQSAHKEPFRAAS